jgi:two-component system sensor histidine kinase GlrK
MRLSIFWRLNVGYAAIVILLITISLLAVLNLNQLKNLTRSILISDYPALDIQAKLIDSILSQIGLEKKYLVLEDPLFYKEFETKKEEILGLFPKFLELAEGSENKALVAEAQSHYLEYLNIFQAELILFRAKKDYPVLLYQQDKERAIASTNQALKKLMHLIQTRMNTKIENSEKISSRAGRLIAAIGILSVLLGLTLSILITRDITHPLKRLEHTTKAIAKGDFNQRLNIISPPEIAELAQAFTYMCSRLQELDNLKKDFISNISHELRTPLTAIKESSYILYEEAIGGINQEQREFLAIIIEESKKLERYINDLLDLSRMEAGMMSYNYQSCDFAHIINHTILSLKPLIQKKEIQIETKIKNDVPPVMGDSARLEQLMTNLLNNALKFTSDGGMIRISVDRVALTSVLSKIKNTPFPLNPGISSSATTNNNQEVTMVSISDTGPGIRKEDRQKIFDKFYQINQDSDPGYQGSGLGLSIAKHIVEAHGGNIWVESEPGKGSTFHFILP